MHPFGGVPWPRSRHGNAAASIPDKQCRVAKVRYLCDVRDSIVDYARVNSGGIPDVARLRSAVSAVVFHDIAGLLVR